MNRAYQHKFQQIARPYIMSNSQGGTLQRTLKHALGSHTTSYGAKNFMTNAASKYSLQSSVGTSGTERDPHLLKRHLGLPDLSTIHSHVDAAPNHGGAFSPKTAALLATDPGHRSHATFGSTEKFSPRRVVRPF